MERGLRAKSRTHATAPYYEQQRRQRHAALVRTEKREERQARRSRLRTVDHLALFIAARRVLANRHFPYLITWEKPW